MKKLFDFLYHRSMRIGREKTPFFYGVAYRYRTIAKFIFSGGTAAFVDLGLLYLLTDFLGLWYLLSAIFAFLVSFVVSFLLQKFWAFRDSDMTTAKRQAISYLFVGVINLFLNTALVYFFVDIVELWYMAAQVLASGLIAIASFFVYKHFIFSK